MTRWIKRLLVLLLVGAGGGAAIRVLRQRAVGVQELEAPQWPPFEPMPATAPRLAVAPVTDLAAAQVISTSDVGAANSETSTWMPSVDGQCPDGFPIKANDNSGIFHVPGGRFYERTIAERCYTTPQAAVADGYRQAKN